MSKLNGYKYNMLISCLLISVNSSYVNYGNNNFVEDK